MSQFNKSIIECLKLLPVELENKILFFNHNIKLSESLTRIKEVYNDVNKYLMISNEDHNDTMSIEFFQDYFLDEIEEKYWIELAFKYNIEKYRKLVY